jgi:peptidyl-prolyl cis-trans isomerase A (cyclophilin A)
LSGGPSGRSATSSHIWRISRTDQRRSALGGQGAIRLPRLAMRLFLLLLAIFSAVPAAAQRADRATPGYVRVRLETALGAIVLALDARRAPATTANFMKYVDDGRFDGVSFYRVARNKKAPQFGFIQSGIRTDARRFLDMIPHESTKRTGIKHLDMTISMARRGPPGSANGNWFIAVGAMPWMDWQPKNPGYAAFGRVVAGQAVVKRILAQQTGGAMNGTLLLRPIYVKRAVRLDGKPKPSGRPKPWVLEGRKDG